MKNRQQRESYLEIILRLRWLAVLGLLACTLAADWFTDVLINWKILLPAFGIGLGANFAAHVLRDRLTSPQQRELARGLLLFDSLLLAVILVGSGGAHNPFSSLYLLNVFIGAILFGRLTAVWIAVIALGSFGYLYFGMPELCNQTVGISHDLHIQGMVMVLGIMSAVIVVFVDGLKRAHAQVQAKLEEKERMDALATLATGVAHELATPLGTIAVAAKELEKVACHTCQNGACKDDARLIREQVDRCRAIIDQLDQHNLNRLRNPSEVIDLGRIQELLAATDGGHPGPGLHFEICDGQIPVLAPKLQLLQTIRNLIQNAQLANVRDLPIVVRVGKSGNRAVLEIADEGVGMAPQLVREVGKPFLTTRQPGKGLGMGLFIAKSLVGRLGGDLAIRTKENRGTRVIIELPLANPGMAVKG